MRLIDADALKAYLGMSDECEKCKRDARLCQFDQVFTRMDVCEMIDDAPTVGGWISVKDRLPDVVYEDRFLIVKKHDEWGTKICITNRYKWKGDTKWEDPGVGWEITHWMPLPEPQEVDDA